MQQRRQDVSVRHSPFSHYPLACVEMFRVMWDHFKGDMEAALAEADRYLAYAQREQYFSEEEEYKRADVVKKCTCGGTVFGWFLPECERRASGRYYYEECDKCSYWRELRDVV